MMATEFCGLPCPVTLHLFRVLLQTDSSGAQHKVDWDIAADSPIAIICFTASLY